MEFFFDHLVHFVNDPVRVVDILRQNGIQAREGGRHAMWGSYNSLCYFDLSYIEYLGIEDRSLAEQVTDNSLIMEAVRDLPANEGFASIALRTGDINKAAERVRACGFEVTGPFPGKRTRDDGSEIVWSMFFIKGEASGGPLPFVIQWGQADEERRRELRERNVIVPHSLGPLSLDHVAFAVSDPERVAETWKKLFGLDNHTFVVDRDGNAEGYRVQLAGGDLLFLRPRGEGLASESLASRGERPFAVRVKGANQALTIRLFGGLYEFTKKENEQ